MKKLLLLFVFISLCLNVLGQTSRRLINSYLGIEVQKIGLMSTGQYSVTFFNNNEQPVSYRTFNCFYWYLSYKGKRVSEYVMSTDGCRLSKQETIWAWPDEVPSGHEKYVSVQFGRETVKRDSRDDE